MLVRLIFLVFIFQLLQGCSFVVDLAFFNNTSEKVEVCNINKSRPNCFKVNAQSLVKIPLIANTPSDKWQYSINHKKYSFKFGQYPEHASNVYCSGFIQKQCDVAVQYQSNELLYWAGKSSELPVKSFGFQPEGFPVKPNT